MIFLFFCHNVFISCLLQKCQKASVCGKGLNRNTILEVNHESEVYHSHSVFINYKHMMNHGLEFLVIIFHIFSLLNNKFMNLSMNLGMYLGTKVLW